MENRVPFDTLPCLIHMRIGARAGVSGRRREGAARRGRSSVFWGEIRFRFCFSACLCPCFGLGMGGFGGFRGCLGGGELE